MKKPTITPCPHEPGRVHIGPDEPTDDIVRDCPGPAEYRPSRSRSRASTREFLKNYEETFN